MGYLYRHKLRGSTKSKPRLSAIWWVKYYRDGIAIRESTGTEKEQEARRFLKAREGRVATGQPILPRADRIRYEELAEDLRRHYRTTGRRNLDEVEDRLFHLGRFFRGWRVVAIGPSSITAYVEQRQKVEKPEQPAPANRTINIELALLKRMLRLAYKNGKVLRVPPIEMLREAPPRQGFFGEIEFLAVQAQLPEPLRAPAAFAYTIGWRKEEVLGLTWRRVDLERGLVRLDPEPDSTKKRGGRTVVLPEDLHLVLQEQWERTRALVLRKRPEATPREVAEAIPWVFHRKGKPIRSFRKAWEKACERAGLGHRLFHDLRRTAVRNMVRAGIPDLVAMKISGHKTRSVFDRYNIVAEADLQEAARKLAGRFSGRAGQIAVDQPTATAHTSSAQGE